MSPCLPVHVSENGASKIHLDPGGASPMLELGISLKVSVADLLELLTSMAKPSLGSEQVEAKLADQFTNEMTSRLGDAEPQLLETEEVAEASENAEASEAAEAAEIDVKPASEAAEAAETDVKATSEAAEILKIDVKPTSDAAGTGETDIRPSSEAAEATETDVKPTGEAELNARAEHTNPEVCTYKGSKCTVSLQINSGKALVSFESQLARDAVIQLIEENSKNGAMSIKLRGIDLAISTSRRSAKALRVSWNIANEKAACKLRMDVIAAAFDIAYEESTAGSSSTPAEKRQDGTGKKAEQVAQAPAAPGLPMPGAMAMFPPPLIPPFMPTAPGLTPQGSWTPEMARVAFASAAAGMMFPVAWNAPGHAGIPLPAAVTPNSVISHRSQHNEDAKVWKTAMLRARAESEAGKAAEVQEVSERPHPKFERETSRQESRRQYNEYELRAPARPKNYTVLPSIEELVKKAEAAKKALQADTDDGSAAGKEPQADESVLDDAQQAEQRVEQEEEAQIVEDVGAADSASDEPPRQGSTEDEQNETLREEHELLQQMLADPAEGPDPKAAEDAEDAKIAEDVQVAEDVGAVEDVQDAEVIEQEENEEVCKNPWSAEWRSNEPEWDKCSQATAGWDRPLDMDSEEALTRDVLAVLRESPQKLVRMASGFGFAKRYNAIFHGGTRVNNGSWTKWLQMVPGVSVESSATGSFTPDSVVTLQETWKGSSWDSWNESKDSTWQWQGKTWSAWKNGNWRDWEHTTENSWDSPQAKEAWEEWREKRDSNETFSARKDRKRWVIKE